MLQEMIMDNKEKGVTMDYYPSLEVMMEEKMWPYPSEKELSHIITEYGSHMVGGAYGFLSWRAKEDLKNMLRMGMWQLGDGSMIQMVQGMMGSNETWSQVKEGMLCMYDQMAKDEEMAMMMEEVMARNEVEGMMGTMAGTAMSVADYEEMGEDVMMLLKKVYGMVEWMDMDTDFTMVYGIMMQVKSRILEIPVMEIYKLWHKAGAEFYFKVKKLINQADIINLYNLSPNIYFEV